MSSVSVFASFLSAATPGHGPSLPCLVDSDGVSGVVFTPRAVRVDLFWKLQIVTPGRKDRASWSVALLSVILKRGSYFDGHPLPDEAFRVLIR